MDQVHIVRHKVLVEGRSQRAVARELGLARVTVRKYLDQAVPLRHGEVVPRPRPVWDAVAERVQALLVESVRWTGGKQRLTATRLHERAFRDLGGVPAVVRSDNLKAGRAAQKVDQSPLGK